MFPVVCTFNVDAKASEQFIDGFLREAYDGYPEASQDLCIITTKDKAAYQYDESDPNHEKAHGSTPGQTQGGGPMITPSRPPWSMEFRSPFLRQSPEQVADFLSKEFNDTTSLETGYCAIIDEKSLRDRSALLVVQKEGQQDEDEPSIGELGPEDHLASGAPTC
ncbi:hypothetical protein Q7P36_011471 [Cladosporium allicinum]